MRASEKNKLFDLFIKAVIKAQGDVATLLLRNAKNSEELKRFLSAAYTDIYLTLNKHKLPKKYKDVIEKAWKKLRPDVEKRLKRLGMSLNDAYKGNDVVEFMKKWGGLQVDNMTKRYSVDVYSATIRAAYGVDFEAGIKELQNKLPLMKKRYAPAIVETSWRTMEAEYTMKQAEKVGVQKFRYDGPADQKNRPFCAEHVGKVYTLDEIKDMVNDFGEPALEFRGGWNCRHYWTPIVE